MDDEQPQASEEATAAAALGAVDGVKTVERDA